MAADSLTAPALDTPGGRARGPGWRDQARSSIYWGLAHGLPRVMVRRAARRGDLQGRLMLAPSSGDQVWELFEEARARGPLLRSRVSYLTVDHATVKEVLSSPDFHSGRHYCLGASLARMEGEVGLRAITERFPDLRLLPGARRRPTRVLRGYATLPASLR